MDGRPGSGGFVARALGGAGSGGGQQGRGRRDDADGVLALAPRLPGRGASAVATGVPRQRAGGGLPRPDPRLRARRRRRGGRCRLLPLRCRRRCRRGLAAWVAEAVGGPPRFGVRGLLCVVLEAFLCGSQAAGSAPVPARWGGGPRGRLRQARAQPCTGSVRGSQVGHRRRHGPRGVALQEGRCILRSHRHRRLKGGRGVMRFVGNTCGRLSQSP
mmetsp:Transcript_60645/g.154112  ORF Transcript_60645/g.154112 Transcript_60645/m.154112 type:complete len:215 (+) Transcript_60645:463-1107(+)